jgi:hypothetical protein
MVAVAGRVSKLRGMLTGNAAEAPWQMCVFATLMSWFAGNSSEFAEIGQGQRPSAYPCLALDDLHQVSLKSRRLAADLPIGRTVEVRGQSFLRLIGRTRTGEL